MEKSFKSFKCFDRAAALCSGSEQCSADMRGKLARWGVDEDEADAIVARLVDEGFINDARYARAFAHDHIRYHRWGRVKIAYMLRQKGIGSHDVDAALAAIDDEWVDEYDDALRATVEQAMPSGARRGLLDTDDCGDDEPQPDWQARQKLRAKVLRHAAAHGFTADEIYRILEAGL